MNIKEILRDDCIIYELVGNTKEEIIKEMCLRLKENNAINDVENFYKDVMEREKVSHTAFEGGIATPHAKSSYVLKPTVILGMKKEGVDFSNGEEEKSKLIFLIAAPDTKANLHIDILSSIANIMDDEDKINKILNATNYEDIINVFVKEEKEEDSKTEDRPYILAVTACPTGIAHTFMARDSLVKAAKEMGVDIKVETNGTDGRKNEITKEDMEKAKGIILAINKSVDEDRFNGMNMIKVSAKDGISKAKELIQDIIDGKTTKANFTKTNSSEEKSNKTGIYSYLMNGVSYMLPLVVSGGILIAIAFLFDTIFYGKVNLGGAYGSTSYLAKLFMEIGGAAFSLFIPILAGFIAYGISKKSSLAAGLVAGSLAVSGGSGFLGAIVGGLLAGYLVNYLDKLTIKLNQSLRGIYLILVIPVISVFITGVAMILILNPIVGSINLKMTNFLNELHSHKEMAILLGALLGGMMAVDMGGPINKAAYLFGVGSLTVTTNSAPMAAVMAGGMVPPLAIALSTTIFKNKYSFEDRQAGITNYVLGLSFITEGAIPFAAKDPLRVIPASVIGASIAGAITMLMNVTIPAPHGGILVMFLSNKILIYIFAVLIGSIISAIILGILKKRESE